MVMMETEQWWELVQETWGAIMTMMRKWCDVFMQGSLRVHPRRIGYHSLSQCPDLCVSRGADPPLTPERALQQMAVEEAQVSLFTMLAAKFTKLNPDIEAHFLVASADKEQEKGAELSSSSVSSPVARGRSCLVCGQAVVAREESECAKHGCDTGKLHAACLEACAKCGKGFCTAGHKNDHGCQND